MDYNLQYKKSVERDLRKLPRNEIVRILDYIENELINNPGFNDELQGRFAGLRKCRIGDYRVIYSIVGVDVLILRIGHRKDVNKKKT